MARGQLAAEGKTRTAPNGYHYTKQAGRWRLTHHITMEKKLGRSLRDNEMVKFKSPKFKREPYNPEGIYILEKGTTSLRAREAQLEARIEELQEQLRNVRAQIKSSNVVID